MHIIWALSWSSGTCPKLFANAHEKDEQHGKYRARIFKLKRRPRIDSKKPIPPVSVAWRAGTTTLFLFGS